MRTDHLCDTRHRYLTFDDFFTISDGIIRMRLIFDFIMFCKTGFIGSGKIYF